MPNKKQSQENIAGKYYEPHYYNSNSEVESGIATTHEQASDTLVEGTIDGKIDNLQGKDKDIPRKGYGK